MRSSANPSGRGAGVGGAPREGRRPLSLARPEPTSRQHQGQRPAAPRSPRRRRARGRRHAPRSARARALPPARAPRPGLGWRRARAARREPARASGAAAAVAAGEGLPLGHAAGSRGPPGSPSLRLARRAPAGAAAVAWAGAAATSCALPGTDPGPPRHVRPSPRSAGAAPFPWCQVRADRARGSPGAGQTPGRGSRGSAPTGGSPRCSPPRPPSTGPLLLPAAPSHLRPPSKRALRRRLWTQTQRSGAGDG